MKLFLSFFILHASIAMLSRASFFQREAHSSNRDEAIQIAIKDFETTRLFKNDSVFSVSYLDTVHRSSWKRSENGIYEPYVQSSYNDLMSIGILGVSGNRVFLLELPKIGIKGKYPSRFIVLKRKLFFWYDDEYPLTEEALLMFRKYCVVPPSMGEEFEIPEILIDDSKKGAQYYFCRNNLLKYKRVITNKGSGSYDPPKLDCHSN
jgi:hypothetical protein